MWRIKDGVVKIGMFGATTNGTMRDIDVAPVSLKSVTVGSIDTVDCISFNFEDKDGNELAVGPWGGTLGRDHTFVLKSNEYVREVSGTFGPFATQHLDRTVNSLTFVTSQGTIYGPFGTPNGTSFRIPVEKASIVGFYALADGFVSAIGFYVRQ
uniref:Jacalin-type lectin domain-containing protein n=2 Tax=Oryza glaberrima TaxID=4538 RepID=I1NMZ0_ORYGL